MAGVWGLTLDTALGQWGRRLGWATCFFTLGLFGLGLKTWRWIHSLHSTFSLTFSVATFYIVLLYDFLRTHLFRGTCLIVTPS